MTEPIVSRESIALDAEAAALRMLATGVSQPNPWPPESTAAAEWKAALERYLVAHSSDEAEVSA
jgi:hypothetical protein